MDVRAGQNLRSLDIPQWKISADSIAAFEPLHLNVTEG
jgi:hypothetical protein